LVVHLCRRVEVVMGTVTVLESELKTIFPVSPDTVTVGDMCLETVRNRKITWQRKRDRV
jgi:hypothetical protein